MFLNPSTATARRVLTAAGAGSVDLEGLDSIGILLDATVNDGAQRYSELDRDTTSKLRVVGAIDDPHAASSELGLDPVVTE